MADRDELIRNALSFLTDPNTRNHPLTQRIAFLESKGLTAAEIESVLAQSGNGSTSAVAPSPATGVAAGPGSPYGFGPIPASSYAPQYATMPPAVPQRDWRDYFIMAVVSGGFLFGVVSFARKYLVPHLKPPSVTAYETDQQALTAQFDEIAKLVASIDSDTAAQRTLLEEQKEKVDGALDKLQIAIRETKEAETKTKADLRDIREEVNNVRDMLPKMLEKNKDAQSQALVDLQQELKSLKTLLLSRSGPGVSSLYGGSGPTSPSIPGNGAPYGAAPPLIPRPTIPSWQLATPPAQTAFTPAPAPAVIPESALPKIDKGKGKEVVEPLASSGVLVSDSVSSDDESAIVS